MRVEFTIPIRTYSEANDRSHWTVKLKRKHNQQGETWVALYQAKVSRGGQTPYRVKLTRYGPKALDPGDNLNISFKAVRDSIAQWLGVNDGDTKKINFQYDQVPNGKRDYYVKVEIESG